MKGLIEAGRYYVLVIFGERDGCRFVLVDVDRANTVPIISAPELHLPIISTSHHETAVVCDFTLRELSIANWTDVSRDCMNAASLTHIPDFDGVVIATRRKLIAVRKELHIENLLQMSFQM